MVSVIIPTHNRANLLPRAVRSVFDQTYENYEIIIVDDCSTDRTTETVMSWEDDRIKYIRHTENRRQSASLNTGIDAAMGEYIAFLDDDDEWMPDKLEQQVAEMESCGSEVGLVYGWLDQVDDTTRKVQPKYRKTMSGDLSTELMALSIPAPTITLMVRAHVARKVGGFDESLGAYNDLDFLVKVSQQCDIAAVARVVAVQHVGHGHGRMNVDSKVVLVEKVNYIRQHMRRYSSQLSRSPASKARVLLHLARNEVLAGNSRAGLTTLCNAVKLDPLGAGALIATRGFAEMARYVVHRFGRR